MPRTKTTPAPEETVETVPILDLEQLTEEALSQVTIVGNAMVMAIAKLRTTHPGWADMLDSIRMTLGEAVQVYKP